MTTRARLSYLMETLEIELEVARRISHDSAATPVFRQAYAIVAADLHRALQDYADGPVREVVR